MVDISLFRSRLSHVSATFLLQQTASSFIGCLSTSENHSEHGNRTEEIVFIMLRKESPPQRTEPTVQWYQIWYIWVVIGTAVLLAVGATSLFIVKMQNRVNMGFEIAQIHRDTLYQTVQDSSGLIRPSVQSKVQIQRLNVNPSHYDSNDSEDFSKPLAPAYPAPLYLTGTTFNDQQLASIILPPGCVPRST